MLTLGLQVHTAHPLDLLLAESICAGPTLGYLGVFRLLKGAPNVWKPAVGAPRAMVASRRLLLKSSFVHVAGQTKLCIYIYIYISKSAHIYIYVYSLVSKSVHISCIIPYKEF